MTVGTEIKFQSPNNPKMYATARWTRKSYFSLSSSVASRDFDDRPKTEEDVLEIMLRHDMTKVDEFAPTNPGPQIEADFG